MATMIEAPDRGDFGEFGLSDDDVLPRRELLRSKILIIDDDRITCEILLAYLNEQGYENIGFAFDGENGIDKIEGTDPDLVILDIDMPVMNGFEVLDRIRADGRYNDLPIIVETGLNSSEERNRVLSSGATNIISKPIDRQVLLHRVHHHLENRHVFRKLRAFQQRLAHELRSARNMQANLLPRPALLEEIEAKSGVGIDWHFQASSEVGGDWLGMQPLTGRMFSVALVDFTGHGVGAAINTFRLHTILAENPIGDRTPAGYLEMLNPILVDMLPRGTFATMIFGIVDPDENVVRYASSGSTRPLFGKERGSRIEFGDSSGIPLGISMTATYTDHEVPFHPGDFFMFYSDALIEEERNLLPPLDESGVVNLILQAREDGQNKDILKTLLRNFYRRYSGALQDDLSAVMITRGNL